MRILVTGAGGAAAISVWKSLASEHELYMGDIDPCAAGLYLVPEKQRLILPPGDSPSYAQTMLDYCVARQIELVIATVDIELGPLAAAEEQFIKEGIKIPLSPYEVLQLCYDKYALLTACKDLKEIPEFVLLTPATRPTITSFPRFAKPRLGAGSRGIAILNSQDDLDRLPKDGSYLVQELLPGKEYSVDVYIHSSGQPVAAVPRIRMKIDSGIAVAARTTQLPELVEKAVLIASRVGIRYMANIQFKQAQDGQYKLLEINPRFPGTLPLTAAAGVDMPKLLINDIQGKQFNEGLMPFKELMVVRYWTEHYFPTKEWETLCQL